MYSYEILYIINIYTHKIPKEVPKTFDKCLPFATVRAASCRVTRPARTHEPIDAEWLWLWLSAAGASACATATARRLATSNTSQAKPAAASRQNVAHELLLWLRNAAAAKRVGRLVSSIYL